MKEILAHGTEDVQDDTFLQTEASVNLPGQHAETVSGAQYFSFFVNTEFKFPG